MSTILNPPLKRLSRRSGMSLIARLATVVVVAWIVQAGQPLHAGIVVVDFENNPSLPAQPNNFFTAGPEQTYTQAGVYSISGGVVLGNPSFLAAFAANGSAPNLYGTADFADPSLLDTITLTLPSAELITTVSGVFFNGQAFAESYVLTAMSGVITVGTSAFTLADNSSASDFNNFSFNSTTALPITSVTFTTPNAGLNGYDFFVDTIAITPGSTGSLPVPEPSTYLMFVQFGMLGLAGVWVRRKRVAV